MDYILSNFTVSGLPIEQFCMSKGVKKKKNFPSGTRVSKTRVPLRKIEQHGETRVPLGKFFSSILCLGREFTKTEH